MLATSQPAGWSRTWATTVLAGWLVLLSSWPTDVLARDTAWSRAVEAYLDGRVDDVAAVLDLPNDAVRRQAREALDGWLAQAGSAGPQTATAERRLAVRRVQGAAALAVELLVRLSGTRRPAETLEGFERAGIEAWEQLARMERVRLETLDAPGREAREQERRALQRFRTIWQVAFLQYLVTVGRHGDFEKQAPFVRLGEAPTETQAEFHLLEGLRQETASRYLVLGRGDRTSALGNTYQPALGMPTSRQRLVNAALDRAGEAYRRALDLAPDHGEARLHFGRVALDRRRPDDAIARLASLVTSPCRTVICGLAALFTGEAHEQRSALEDASRAYAIASSVQDVRQSALLAMMQLAVRRGDSSRSAGLVTHFASSAPLAQVDQPDAWSAYVSGQRASIEGVLAPLRMSLLR